MASNLQNFLKSCFSGKKSRIPRHGIVGEKINPSEFSLSFPGPGGCLSPPFREPEDREIRLRARLRQ
jgi:hypothetical protein